MTNQSSPVRKTFCTIISAPCRVLVNCKHFWVHILLSQFFNLDFGGSKKRFFVCVWTPTSFPLHKLLHTLVSWLLMKSRCSFSQHVEKNLFSLANNFLSVCPVFCCCSLRKRFLPAFFCLLSAVRSNSFNIDEEEAETRTTEHEWDGCEIVNVRERRCGCVGTYFSPPAVARLLSQNDTWKGIGRRKPATPLSKLIARWKFVDVGSKKVKVLINSIQYSVQFFIFEKRKIIYCSIRGSIDACVNQIITVIYFCLAALRAHCRGLDNACYQLIAQEFITVDSKTAPLFIINRFATQQKKNKKKKKRGLGNVSMEHDAMCSQRKCKF